MNYKARLQKLIGVPDPYWVNLLDKFVTSLYKNIEVGVQDLEKLAKDGKKFDEFTKRLSREPNNYKQIKEEFIQSDFLTINIKTWHYRGKIGKGTIFEHIVGFVSKNKFANVQLHIKYCKDSSMATPAVVTTSYPFALKDEENNRIIELTNNLSKISFDENKVKNISERYKYVELTINERLVYVEVDNKAFLELLKLIRSDYVEEAVSAAYNIILKKE